MSVHPVRDEAGMVWGQFIECLVYHVRKLGFYQVTNERMDVSGRKAFFIEPCGSYGKN